MNQRRLFQRKIIYFAAIAALLFPLFALSQPATTKSQGGQLAKLRQKYKLSEADLGQIDPTSVSMKLATFGLQGAAVNLLWSRAIEFKERGDYTNFDATLQQITNLQPHFYKVWDFQGHNVAFNISVEFDDYRDRYHHVIKGFNLLKKGIRFNEKEARLLRRLAFYTGLKIGRSDEKRYFRPMFAADRDYHSPPRDENPLTGTRYEGRPESLTDNWLVAKWWYKQAEDLIDSGVIPYGTMNAFLVHSEPAMQQLHYAEGLENDGHFGAEVIDAWKEAGREWLAFGLRAIPTTRGFEVKLEDVERLKENRNKAYEELVALEPGLRAQLRKDRIAELPAAERGALEKPAEERDPQEADLAAAAEIQIKITTEALAEATDKKYRAQALKLAERYRYYQARYMLVNQYRELTINYSYWKNRAELEQTEQLMQARKLLYDAEQSYRDSDIPAARSQYEKGFDLWRTILNENPGLLAEETFVGDLMEEVEGYQKVLAQIREDGSRELPDDFALPDVLQVWQELQTSARGSG
jgi:hypothetical protein